MDVLYVCMVVDEGSPALANQVRWIRALATRADIDEMTVLTARVGHTEFPDNVEVLPFGTRRWWLRVGDFYRVLWRLRRRCFDFAFVAMGGPYPALLLPWKALKRRPVYHWKAHPYVSWRMRFYAHVCDDLVFTATPRSLPIRSRKLRVVGHGVDTELFEPCTDEPERDLVVVGRISPVKRIDQMIRVLRYAVDHYGVDATLDIIGPTNTRNRVYEQELRALCDELGLGERVRFLGPTDHAQLPAILCRYRANLNFSETALDKSALEAMAAGVPVLTTNERIAEAMPSHLRDVLFVDSDDTGEQARALVSLLRLETEDRRAVGRALRASTVAHHGIERLFDAIMGEINAHIDARSKGMRP